MAADAKMIARIRQVAVMWQSLVTSELRPSILIDGVGSGEKRRIVRLATSDRALSISLVAAMAGDPATGKGTLAALLLPK
jgi:hypothetical protein